MRIAVLFYGRLNQCAKTFEHYKEVLGNEHIFDFFMSSDASEDKDVESFLHLYKPIAYTNEKVYYFCNLALYPGARWGEVNLHNMTCHLINKGRVFRLMEDHCMKNSVQYDLILSLRIDLHFSQMFPFQIPEENTVYVPKKYDHVVDGLNDQIAYGNMETMKKYMTIFDNTISLLDAGKSIPHPETLNLANLRYHNVKVVRFDLKYYIDR